jgi:Ca-activated chloride channel family protein
MNKMPASLEAEMEKQNVSIAAKNTGQNTSLATPTESSAENATQNNEARFRGTVTGGTSMKGVARQSRTMSPGDPSTNMPATPPATTLNPNMYVASNYLGGSGQRERLEKLIQEGVLVDGKRVKLEAFAREYKQNFAIPTQKALNVFADTERSQIITSGDRTFLQVGIQAMQGETPQRPPLNIALVIDQSGSMSGENKMSDARKAARELVDRLRPDDTIAVVVFNDQAKLLVPAGRATDKNTLRKKIEAIQSGGGTNIYDGLKMGFYEASKASGGSGVVSLVILLSDGQVSSGIKDPDTFRKLVASHASDNDIQTTTVGVGVEYNEDLMLALAQEGKGNYHFLKNGADAPKVFAQELDDLSQIVAKAVKARIVLAPGVGLVRVLGTRKLDAQETQKVKADEKAIDRKVYEELGIQTNRQNEPEEPGIKMLIPNFHRGDSHVILLEVELPSGSGNKKVADVYLKYKDLARPANRQETVATSVTYTTDRSAAIASVDRNVKKNVLGFQTGEALMKAAERIAQGQFAEAMRVVDERMVVVGVAAKTWNDADLNRDGKLLDSYKTVIASAAQNPSLAQSELGDYLKKSLTYNAYQRTR